MPVIRSICQDGHEYDQYRPSDITILFCVESEESTYTFRCVRCENRLRTVKPAGEWIIQLLETAGCKTVQWNLPNEPHKDGPAFIPDDLLNFHLLLEEGATI